MVREWATRGERRERESIAFLAGGRLILTAGQASPVRIRDGRVEHLQRTASEPVEAIRVWDLATEAQIGQFHRDPLSMLAPADRAHRVCDVQREVHQTAISADGRMLATAEDDRRVLLYDVATGHVLAKLEGHDGRVTALAFSGDGTRLVTTSSDDLTALVWDLTSLLGEPAERKAVPASNVDGQDDKAVVAGRVVDFQGKPAVEPAPVRAVDLAPPVRITAAGKPIDVDGFAAPFMGDFDEDGTNDLLVGQVGYGRLRIYRNVGTNARPKFDSFEWFTAGGRIACVPVGCVVGFTPQLVDVDGDGRTDLVTGSFNEAALYLFRRNPDGTFAEAEVLENKHGEVQMGRIPYNATVFVHDWDDDGDGDLLHGRSYCLVPNEGTRRQPIFGDAVPLELLGEPISSGMIGPCVADWDGDGRHDLLGSRRGDIVWYRNTGTRGHPVLQYPEVLVSSDGWELASDRSDDRPARPRAICTADFTGDGRLDLLLGDHYFVKRDLTEEQSARFAEARKTGNAIRDECRKLIRERPEDETQQERIERFRKALRKWQELEALPWAYGGQGDRPEFERHGNVWLYERIATTDPRAAALD
jgi:WD40 repeat protein